MNTIGNKVVEEDDMSLGSPARGGGCVTSLRSRICVLFGCGVRHVWGVLDYYCLIVVVIVVGCHHRCCWPLSETWMVLCGCFSIELLY